MSVTDHERDYFRRIGAVKKTLRDDGAAAHARLSLSERLERSWQFYLHHRQTHQCYRQEDPTPFYERARELGLHRDCQPDDESGD